MERAAAAAADRAGARLCGGLWYAGSDQNMFNPRINLDRISRRASCGRCCRGSCRPSWRSPSWRHLVRSSSSSSSGYQWKSSFELQRQRKPDRPLASLLASYSGYQLLFCVYVLRSLIGSCGGQFWSLKNVCLRPAGSSLDVAAIQQDNPEELDYNKELTTVGISNIAAGLAGAGMTGSYIFS